MNKIPNKISNKKQRLEAYIGKAVICNVPKKSEHCLTQCIHGRLHENEPGKESCAKLEFCSLGLSGTRKVKCKHLTKKDQKIWVKNNMQGVVI